MDGYAVACTVGNGFPKLAADRLMQQKVLGPTDDGEPRRLLLKIRETVPGMGNVRRENERELALEHRERIK